MWADDGVTHGPSSPGTWGRVMQISRFKIRTGLADQVTQSLSFWVGGKEAPRQAGWGETWAQVKVAALLGLPGSPEGGGVVLLFLKERYLPHDVSFYGMTSVGLALCCGHCQGSRKKMSTSQHSREQFITRSVQRSTLKACNQQEIISKQFGANPGRAD